MGTINPIRRLSQRAPGLESISPPAKPKDISNDKYYLTERTNGKGPESNPIKGSEQRIQGDKSGIILGPERLPSGNEQNPTGNPIRGQDDNIQNDTGFFKHKST